MDRSQKRILFVIVLVLIGYAIYSSLPMIIAFTSNILYLVLMLAGIVFLVVGILRVWERL